MQNNNNGYLFLDLQYQPTSIGLILPQISKYDQQWSVLKNHKQALQTLNNYS